MLEVGTHVDHEGQRAIVTGIRGGNPPTYQVRYLPPSRLDRGSTVRAEELQPLEPFNFEVGQQVSIAGIRAEIVAELPGNRYGLQAAIGDQRGKGYAHTSEWVVEGWKLALM